MLVLATLLLAWAGACACAQAATADTGTLYVSPAGNDSADGTEGHPLRTIGQALKLVAPGATIEVAAGQYPPFRTNRLFAEPITIHGQGTGVSIVEGDPELQAEGAIELWGAAGIVLEGLTVHGGRVYITDERNHELHRGSVDITLREDELVGEEGLGFGVTVRSGSERITIERCFIHDLVSGITGPNYRVISGVDTGQALVDGVTVRDNRIERFKQDAMQFADWNDVAIEGNVMGGARHDPPPAPQYHNDLIQFTGYSKDVRIVGNYLSDSAQEIFIQPAFGPIEDVIVENNVLWKSRDYAVQSQAVSGLRFAYNTLWDSRYGMIIRGGPNGEPAATDGVLVGNIIEKLAYPTGTLEEYNLVGVPQRTAGYGLHDLLGVDPGFAEPATGDLRLLDGSAAIAAGDGSYAPQIDLAGRERGVPPALGAYEWAAATPTPPGPPPPESEPAEEEEEEEEEEGGEEKETQPQPGPASPGGGAKRPAAGDPTSGGEAAGAPDLVAAGEPGGMPQPHRYPLRLVLRLDGRALAATTILKAPAFCSGGCSVRTAGQVAFAGRGGGAHLKPQRRALAAVLRHGLRLSPRQRVALVPTAEPRPVARLRLRFAAGGQRAAATLRVRFGAPSGTRPPTEPH